MPTFTNDPVVSVSKSPNAPAVSGESSGWEGVHGISHGPAAGVAGFNDAAQGVAQPGVWGESKNWEGVHGISHGQAAGVAGFNDAPQGAASQGVWGESNHWEGVHGVSHGQAAGVAGFNDGPQGAASQGVWGESRNWEGVHGVSHGPAAGVAGFNDAAQGVAQPGVWGESKNAEGVHGVSHGPAAGVVGDSQNGDGVGGTTRTGSQSGVFGINMAKGSVPDGLNRPGGAGVWGHTTVEKGSGVVGSVDPGLQQAAGVIGIGPIAGHFFGDVIVTGDIKLANGDCAEEFDIRADISVEAGTVMVLGDDGSLYPSEVAYDKRVAGAVSGAGEYKPGIVLDKQQSDGNRQPIALLGKVYCKVDASFAPVKIGDLLTTSPTPGHAMKATDQFKAFGAVIGKALRPLSEGQELIPVLIALQ